MIFYGQAACFVSWLYLLAGFGFAHFMGKLCQNFGSIFFKSGLQETASFLVCLVLLKRFWFMSPLLVL